VSTVSTDNVNGDAVEGFWLTVSELARQKGVDKAAISRRISRLAEQNLLTTRNGPRGSKLVNVAEFDKVTGETTDGVRQLNGTGQAPSQDHPDDPEKKDHVLVREQARRAAYDADLKQLDLAERLGKVLPIEDVEAAMVKCAEIFVQAVNQLPSRADDLAAAVAKEGSAGARRLMKEIAYDLRMKVSQSMKIVANANGGEGDEV